VGYTKGVCADPYGNALYFTPKIGLRESAFYLDENRSILLRALVSYHRDFIEDTSGDLRLIINT